MQTKQKGQIKAKTNNKLDHQKDGKQQAHASQHAKSKQAGRLKQPFVHIKLSKLPTERVVVITGGSSGLGAELAKQCAKRGDRVFVLSRTQGEALSEQWIACDVTVQAQVAEAIKTIAEQAGTIDVLIANAGVGISGALELTLAMQAKQVFDVNVWGAYHLFQEGVKHMQAGGKVVFISSVCALLALPYRGLYCASKAALNMVSFAASMELSPAGIAVSTICPGEIKTPFTKNRIKDFATNERYGQSIRRSAEHIDLNQARRMDATLVAQKIALLLEKKRLKPFVVIGLKYKVLIMAQKLLPTRLFLALTRQMFCKTK